MQGCTNGKFTLLNVLCEDTGMIEFTFESVVWIYEECKFECDVSRSSVGKVYLYCSVVCSRDTRRGKFTLLNVVYGVVGM